MKKLLSIVLLSLLGTLTLCAQATGGVWLSSSHRQTTRHAGYSSPASFAPAHLPSEQSSVWQPSFGSSSFCYTGSHYSSVVTKVGATSVFENESSSAHTMTKRRWPSNPGDPGAPVGEVPFLLMILLLVGYMKRKRR